MNRSVCIAVLSLLLVLAMSACSDDSGTTGGPDADTGNDVTQDAPGPVTYELFLYFPDDEGGQGDPAEGVNVAIDGADGREELVTDASGAYSVTLDPDQAADITVALEGYVVLSFLGFTSARFDEILAVNPDADQLTMIELFDPVEAAASNVELSFTATGVPENGWFCTTSEEFNWGCNGEGSIALETIPASDEAVLIYAYAYDSDWSMVDSEELELPSVNDDTQLEVTFDGSFETAPTDVPLQMFLPDDTDSVFRTNDILDGGPFPFIVFAPGNHRMIGGAQDEIGASDNEWVQFTLRYFPPAEGDAVFVAVASTDDALNRSFTYLPADPADDGVYLWMDAPRASRPMSQTDDLTSTFEWQQIPDAETYQLRINGEGRVLWVSNVGEATSADLPALPSAYDRTADWPDEGTLGNFQIWAFRDPDGVGAADLDEPLRRDLLQSFTTEPITLTGP